MKNLQPPPTQTSAKSHDLAYAATAAFLRRQWRLRRKKRYATPLKA